MSFDEVRMPAGLALGFAAASRFPVDRVELSDGHVLRQARWATPLRRWSASMPSRQKAFLEELRDFRAARGANGFRFKDWTDFAATDQALGTGDGAAVAFQLRKTYGPTGDPAPLVRTIRKPVAGTIAISVDGVPLAAPGNWAVDTTTGVVTFTIAPAIGAALTWAGEFDVPVAFADDDLTITYLNDQVFEGSQMTIEELRR